MINYINKSMFEFASVSVIIPCYRCTETIERAVNSVFSQSLLPRELILVDDCSDDNGRTLNLLYNIEGMYQGDITIKIISLKINCGPGEARNAGWIESKQPYIAFLDSDDSWHCDKLKIQFLYMFNNECISISGHNYLVRQNNIDIPTDLSIYKLSCTHIGPKSLLFKNRFPTSSVMLKSEIPFRFKKNKRTAEDLLLWQQASFAGLLVTRINVPLVYYFKSLYGVGGLSSDLWKMEKGVLSNFIILFRSGEINIFMFIFAITFSFLKFLRRLIFTFIRVNFQNF